MKVLLVVTMKMKGGYNMDNRMYNRYKGIQLSQPLVELFTDLISEDEVNLRIFIYIGQKMLKAMDPNSDTKLGATVNDMVEDIKVLRPVQQKGREFENVLTNVERKRAERAVQSLLLTGLCYFESVGRSKVIYCTERGTQVLRNINTRQKEKAANKM